MSRDKPENEDLYGDLEKFELERTVLKHEESYKELNEKYDSCLKTIETLKNENKLLKKNITNMERNFASLLLTARTELRRKTMQLDELRKEKDDICFRRNTRNYPKRIGQDSSQPGISDHDSREKSSAQAGPSSNPFRSYTDQNKEHKEIIDNLHKQYRTGAPKSEKITQIKCKTISLNLEGRSPITLKVEDFRDSKNEQKQHKKEVPGNHVENLLKHNEPCLDQKNFKDNENIHVSKTSSGLEISFNKDSTKNNLENTNANFKPVTIYSKRREAQKFHKEDSDKDKKVKIAIAGVQGPEEHKRKSVIPDKTKVNENVNKYDVNRKLDECNITENKVSPSKSTRKPETQQNMYNDALFDDFLFNEFERNDNVSSESKKSEPKSAIKTNENKTSSLEDFTYSEKDIYKNLSKSTQSKTELQQSRPFQSITNGKRNDDDSERKDSQGLFRKRPRSYDFLDLTNSSVNSIELNDLNVTKDLNESQNDLDTSGEDTLFIDVEGLGKTETKRSIQDSDIYNDLSIMNEKEDVIGNDTLGIAGKIQKDHLGIDNVTKELVGGRNNEDLCKDSQGKSVADTISEQSLPGNISTSKEILNNNDKEKNSKEKDIINKNLSNDSCLVKEGVSNIEANKLDTRDTQTNNCTLSMANNNAENSGIVDNKDSNTHIEKDIKSPETGDEDVEMPLLTIQTDKRDGGLEIHPYPPGKFKELFSLHTSKETSNFNNSMNSINNEQNKSLTEVTNNNVASNINETNKISSQVTSVTTHRRDEIISGLGIFTAIPKIRIQSQTPTYFGDRAQSNIINKTLETNATVEGDVDSVTFDSFNKQLENSAVNVANIKRKETNTVALKVVHSVQEIDNENTIEKAQVMFDLYLASPTAPIPSEARLNKSMPSETRLNTSIDKFLGAVGTKKRKSSTPKKTIGSIGRPKKMVGHRIEGFEPITSNKEALEASKLKNALFEEALKSADSGRSGSDATSSSDSLSDCSDKKQEFSKNSEMKSSRDNSLNTENGLDISIEKSNLDNSNIENKNLSSYNISTNSLSRLDNSSQKISAEASVENSLNDACSIDNNGLEKSIVEDNSAAVITEEVVIENIRVNKVEVNQNNSPKDECVKGTPIAKPARKRRNTTYLDNLKSLSVKSSSKIYDSDLHSNKSHKRADNKDIREHEKNKATSKADEGQENRKQTTKDKNTSNLTSDNSHDDIISRSENTSNYHNNSFMKIINLENPRDPRLEAKRNESCKGNEDYSYLIKLKWTYDDHKTSFSQQTLKESPPTLESKSRIPPKPCSSFTVLASSGKQQSKRDKIDEKYQNKLSGKQLPQTIIPDNKLCSTEFHENRKTEIRKFMQDFCKTIENVDEETVSDSMSICPGDESSNASLIGDAAGKNSMAFEKKCKRKFHESNFKFNKNDSDNNYEIKSPNKVHAKFHIVAGVNYIHKSDTSSAKRNVSSVNNENVSSVNKEYKKVDECESKMKPTEIDIFSEIRDDLDKPIKLSKKLIKSKSVEEKDNPVSKKFGKSVHWEDFTKEKPQYKSVSEEITEYLKATQKSKPAKIIERRKTVDFISSTSSDLQNRIQILEDIQICTSAKTSAQDSSDKNDITNKSTAVVETKNLNIIEKRKGRNSLDAKLGGELSSASVADFIIKENTLSKEESAKINDKSETSLPNASSPKQNIPIPLNTTESESTADRTDQHDSLGDLLQNPSAPLPSTANSDTTPTLLQPPQNFHTSFMPKRKTVVEVNFCFKNLPVPQSSISATKEKFSTAFKPKKRKLDEKFNRNTINKKRKVIYSTMEAETLFKNKKERNLNNISEEELQNAVNMILPREDDGQMEMKANSTPRKKALSRETAAKNRGLKSSTKKQKVAAQSVNTLRKSSRIQEKKLAIENEKKLKGRKIKRKKTTKKPAKLETKSVNALIKKSKNDDELYDSLFNTSSEAEPINTTKNNKSNIESNFDSSSDNEFQKVEETFREMFEKSPEVFTAINTSNQQFLEAIRCPNDDNNTKLIKKTGHNKSDEKIKIVSSNNSVITSTAKKINRNTNNKKESPINSKNKKSLQPSCSFGRDDNKSYVHQQEYYGRSTSSAVKVSSISDKCENKENTERMQESHSESEKHDSIVSHQGSLNTSSTQNDSVSERKNISVASSSYVIESVSNNVVNVFITRKKKKKKVC